MSVERNDVDISSLFMWGKEFTFSTGLGKELTVYIRLVGDSELNRSRIYALRSSSKLRNILRDENSDERLAYLPNYEDVTRDNLVEGILSLSIRELAQKGAREIDIPYPTEPSSEDSLEKHEKYQKKVDEYPAKRQAKIEKFINDALDKKRESMAILDKEAVYSLYKKILIDDLCENEMVTAYIESCTYFGIFNDEKYTERTFDSLEEFQNLPKEAKEKFISTYRELEIEQDELKKSLQATQ